MTDKELAIGLLHDLDIVAFVRTAPREYRLSALIPTFYNKLFATTPSGNPHPAPWDKSPMLAFFVDEAEIFFAENNHGKIDSGVWLEPCSDGSELPLIATARYINGAPIITLQCVKEYYNEKVKILRQARNELLERDRLHSILATYKRKSLFDPLTNLYNRQSFEDFLDVQMSNRRNMERGVLSILMIDIDFFKKINDTYGHLVGDTVLTTIGTIMQQSLRRKDIPARFGGEEFVVLTPHTNLQQALLVAEKLRKNVQKYNFGLERQVTISIGVTAYQHSESAQRFIKRADDALYMAKQNGRNQVCHL